MRPSNHKNMMPLLIWRNAHHNQIINGLSALPNTELLQKNNNSLDNLFSSSIIAQMDLIDVNILVTSLIRPGQLGHGRKQS